MTVNSHRLGWIGLGNMGAAMADRLLERGHPLVVYDLKPEAVARLVTRGASAAKSVRDVADCCDIVIGCLPPAGAEAVTSISDGVPSGEACKLYIETSLVGRQAAEDAESRFSHFGKYYLDAPVSGGPRGASEGRLSIMVAGKPQAKKIGGRYLLDFGTEIFDVGAKAGLAQICKLANNMISMTAFAITSEAAVVAAKAGVDSDVLMQILNAGSGRTSASVTKFPHAVLTGTFNGGGSIGLVAEDMELFVSEAKGQGIRTALAENVARLWAVAAAGSPERDYTRLAEDLEVAANVRLRSKSVDE